MQDNSTDLSLSRTFKVLSGQLTLYEIADNSLSSARAKAVNDLIGKVIDSKYKVLSLLGEGGMGAVYHVNHVLLHKEMALKTFRSRQLSAEAWARFQREAQAIGKLTHANIVQVFDFGISEQTFPYYTMELLKGESLADLIARRGRLPMSEALPIFIAVAEALAHTHKLDIVHRDIKPANIFMQGGTTGLPKLVDFGLAKLTTSQITQVSQPAEQNLTTAGLVFGSPLYMSPEQSMGLETDGRTDIYSFGCSLYQALAGVPPFVGTSALATIAMHQQNRPPSLNCGAAIVFPERLEAIVAKLLRKEVSRRYQSFDEVIQELSLLSVGSAGTNRQRQAGGRQEIVSKSEDLPESSDRAAQSESITGGKRKIIGLVAGFIVVAAVFICAGLLKLQDDSQIKTTTEQTKAVAPAVSSTTDAATDLPKTEVPKEVLPLYFSKKLPNNYTEFYFPIGGEDWGKIGPELQEQPARGRLTFPTDKALVLLAGYRFRESPDLFAKFRSDDLYKVSLQSKLDWTGPFLKEVSGLSELKELALCNLQLPPDFYVDINKLTKLTSIQLSGSSADGKDVARLNCLSQLECFTGDQIPHMTLALDKLTQSKALKTLSLKYCQLNDRDVEKISKADNLRALELDDNPITIQGLRSLERLHKLEKLELAKTKVGPELISEIRNFRRLTDLSLSAKTWLPVDIMRLKQTGLKKLNLNAEENARGIFPSVNR